MSAAIAGAAVAKLHSRYMIGQQVCANVPCAHFGARMAVIENVIAQHRSTPTYLAIGDSITERADLPTLCGFWPINAGISWATVETFMPHARRLADLAKPKFVIVALGTNDALMNEGDAFKGRIGALLASLADWPVIVVPLPPGSGVKEAAKFNAVIAAMDATSAAPLPSVETVDGVHLTAAAYVEWKEKIADAASKSMCP
jgi:lysophospholipase L1-like esterase